MADSQVHVLRADEYATIRDAAHRRPSIGFGVPAIVRYRSFWLSPTKGVDASIPNGPPKDIESQLSSERKVLGDFFDSIDAKLAETLVTPSSAYRGQDRGQIVDQYEYAIYSGNWRGLVVRFVASRHDERVSLTQIIELASKAETVSLNARCNNENNFSRRDMVDEKLKQLKNIIQNPEKPFIKSGDDRLTPAQAAQMQGIVNYLQTEIWRQLDTDFALFERDGDELQLESAAHGSRRSGPAVAMFADFRSAVLPSNPDLLTDTSDHHFFSKAQKEIAAESPDLQTNSIDTLAKHWELVKAWDLAGASPGSEGRPFDIGDRDLVACSVLDYGALYVSGVGYAGGRDASLGAKSVNYLLFTAPRSKRQIGRLSDRINSLGALRLLALRDLDALRQASVDTRILGVKLDDIERRRWQQEVTAQDAHRSGESDLDRFKYLQSWTENLKKFSNDLNKIGSPIYGGITYRINKSTLYAAAYKDLVTHLRVKRIEGFQPYDEFVARRLYELYSFVSRLGERITQLRTRYRTTLEAAQNELLLESNNLQREAAEKRNKLAKAGMSVEMILITYYGGHLIAAALKVAGLADNVALPLGYLLAFLAWGNFSHLLRNMLARIEERTLFGLASGWISRRNQNKPDGGD